MHASLVRSNDSSGRRRRRSLARSSLDLDPLTERRKHLREDDLLVPHRVVRVLLHTGAALQTTIKKELIK